MCCEVAANFIVVGPAAPKEIWAASVVFRTV